MTPYHREHGAMTIAARTAKLHNNSYLNIHSDIQSFIGPLRCQIPTIAIAAVPRLRVRLTNIAAMPPPV